MKTLLCAAVVGALALSAPASAAVRPATAATLLQVLKAAKPGDVVRLTGDVPTTLRISGLEWSQPVTLDASAATLTNVRIERVRNLVLKGGTYQPTGPIKPAEPAIFVNQSFDVTVQDVQVKGWAISFRASERLALLGSTLDSSQMSAFAARGVDGLRVVGNKALRMGVDGFDLFSVRHAVITDNVCAGTIQRPGAHVDCIQMANYPNLPTVEDIEIARNHVTGDTMGINAWHGSYKNIRVYENWIDIVHPNGVSIFDTDGVEIRDNQMRPSKGSTLAPGIRTEGSTNLIRCGNVLTDLRGRVTRDRPCKTK